MTRGALAVVLAMLTLDAVAQQYPSRPIRVIYPQSAGGAADTVIRTLAVEATKGLGQTVIVENRPGGNMIIGADACAKAVPDGHTICLLPIDAVSINPFLFRKLPYDPVADFAPIMKVFYLIEALVVTPSANVATLPGLIDAAKAQPGTINYGSPASFVMLFMEGFKQATGTDMRHVPYKGGGPVVNALLAAEVQVAFLGLANVVSYLKSGRIKLLAVDSDARSPLAPEVPTFAELGYRGLPFRVWFGLFAPANTPAPVLARLRTEFTQVANAPEFREQHLIARGFEPALDPPEQFVQFLRADRARAEQLVKQSGIKPE